MLDYLDILLPDYISRELLCSSRFDTKIINTKSGKEYRYALDIGKKQYVLKNCHITYKQLEEFRDFFSQCKGQQYAFRMKDYLDYQLYNYIIAEGDNKEHTFNIIHPWKKSIIRGIIPESLIIQQNDTVIHPKIDLSLGVIKLPQPLPEGHKLIITTSYDTICRFEQDAFTDQDTDYGTILLDPIKIIEII